MGVSPDYPLAPPSLNDSQQDHNMNLSMLYYSFFVVATAGVLLAIYHCLIVNWCTRSSASWQRTGADPGNAPAVSSSVQGFECRKVVQLESTIFKYMKGGDVGGGGGGGGGGAVGECVVCLSVYEDGEDVRQLLRCNHCFHAPCIDMWLHSHFECPLCREPVGDVKGLIIQQHSGNNSIRTTVSDPINLV